jgi:hypothetical protein
MKILHVKAAPGLKLPKEGYPRAYITDAEAVPVQDSHYYRKAIGDGDLVEVTPDTDEAAAPAPAVEDAA